ncbi:Serine/threonine-protein kinase PknB [Maioricimonas rarisocia]|uniref:Serine/threonine-protein kinase PknB n=1 Tax=Maioricimonas rarisocia TaxID=2528026 RepID=A0A517Z6K6_9PLAN|nr:protein kinase [Maioricimonas rarisocia]QDU38118.1 Serine/threonine-protein kinase PknB [Maioricimonas rarisocia]
MSATESHLPPNLASIAKTRLADVTVAEGRPQADVAADHDATLAGGRFAAGTSEAAVPDDSCPSPAETDPNLGRQIGRYRIDGIIGSGGMGTVYQAEQTHPVRRTVALKMIQSDLANSRVIDRFHLERQTLARMDHPDIACVFDADTTRDGDPYFVMEYCRGLPIDEFCNRHKLTIEERLRLLARVCHAVHYAHSQGFVHRDLKPGNILVAEDRPKPQIRIIDFGIAKALGDDSPFAAEQTRAGEILGTPAYMSPEQARGDAIDARTDVFALGGLMYALLTDSPPIRFDQQTGSSLAGVLNTITEFEPERPRHRLRRFDAATRVRLAETRSMTVQQLAALPSDLDWITLRALAPERTDRYATADDFADDLDRFLDHRPVTAVAPALSYRLRKYVRRHRRTVLSAAAVLATIIVAAGAIAYDHVQASRQEHARTLRLQDEITQILDEARAHHRLARKDRQLLESQLPQIAAACSQAQLLVTGEPELHGLAERVKQQLTEVEKDRRALALVHNLEEARNRATHNSTVRRNTSAMAFADINQMKEALIGFGVVPRKVAPQAAARALLSTPAILHEEIGDALEFWLSEAPVGPGVYVRVTETVCTVAGIVAGGPAALDGTLKPHDELVGLVTENGRLVPFAGMTKQQVYRQLNQPPGTSIRLRIRPSNDVEQTLRLVCGGEESLWVRQTLADVSPSLWAEQLRDAARAFDVDQLRALAGQPDLGSRSLSALLFLSGVLFALDERETAVACLRIAQRAHPHEFWPNHYLGVALNSMAHDRIDHESIRYLTAAVALRPQSAAPRYNLACALEAAGEPTAALEFYRIALEIDPEYAAARLAIKRLEASDTSYTSAGNLNAHRLADSRPQTAADIWQLPPFESEARALAGDGRFEEAMVLLDRAHRDAPEDHRVDRARGIVLLAQGEYAEAQSLLRKTAAIAPDDAATRFYLGLACHYLGLLPDAVAQYEAALTIRPDYAAVHEYLDGLKSDAIPGEATP